MPASSLYQFIRASLSSFHPFFKLVFVFFGMLSVWLFVSLFGILLAIPLFHLGWTEITELLNSNFDAADQKFIKYFQAVQSIGFFMLPGLLLPTVLFDDSKLSGKKRTSSGIVNYILILGTIICSIPLINFLVVWNIEIQLPESIAGFEETLRHFEDEASQLSDQLLRARSTLQFLFVLLIAAVLPAIGEELIFRRILQTILQKWIGNIHLAILATGIIFSAFHMQFFGFFPRLVLGVYFGYLYFWSGNIRLAIWAHFLNNALAIVILQMIEYENPWFTKIFEGEIEVASYLIALSVLLTAILTFSSKMNLSGKKRLAEGKPN